MTRDPPRKVKDVESGGPVERAVNKALQAVDRAETEALKRAERAGKTARKGFVAGGKR
jgi:hypothetical protein